MNEPLPITRVPEPLKSIDATMHDGAIIRIRQHGNPNGPRLVMSHGNGLAIDGYLPFWGPLCGRYEVIVFDCRDHGQNPMHDPAAHVWENFGRDMERIWQTIKEVWGAKKTAGVFHSLSGVAAVMHTLEMGKRWDVLVLFDPPIFPRPGHPLEDIHYVHMQDVAERAARRGERYGDPSELAALFASRPQFSRWVPEACELMARATLRRDEASGDWVLACPRELEAHTFATNVDATLWPRMTNFPVPVKLICADPAIEETLPPALVGSAMGAELPIEYEAIPNTTHFLQIERPKECVRAMESFLAKYGLAA